MIIDGREYAAGIHAINGYLVHVVDRSTYVTLGPAPKGMVETKPEPKPEVEKINVNEADVETLQTLEGVGNAAAHRIIMGRPFESADDLVRVKGVSQKIVDSNRERISV